MGAWGDSYFDNDSALDFLGDLLDGEELDVLVNFDGKELDADSGLGIIAYAAVLAGFKPTDYYDGPELRKVELLVANTDIATRARVKKLLKTALSKKRSELYGLYFDSTEDEWYLEAKKLLKLI